MKNKLLFILLTLVGSITSVSAQTLPNGGFETWVTDTNYLDLTLVTPNLLDTSYSPSPAVWTTSNAISNTTTFHHKTLVTQSASSYAGSSAIQLRSDSLQAVITGVPVVGTLNLDFVCPGFAVCGNFPINFSALVNLGSSFNPALLPGAGIPISGRVAKIGGYLKYSPVGGDTAYIIAVLRQGSDVVATATYKHYSTDAAYTYFEAPFVYLNCLEPDTLVYTLSSGNPYSISGVVTGSPSGLHMGSTLLADSLFLGDTIPGFGIAEPFSDSAHTNINTPISIGVTANDQSCSGGVFTVTTGVAPAHGSISVSGDSIVYSPAVGYAGYDTFTYVESIGGGPDSSAQVVVRVSSYATGISEIAEGKTSIYPNPASSKLHITTSNSSVAELHIYDMLGKVMKAESFTSDATIDVSGFSNGLYIVQFSGNDGKMISSSRFTVIK